jgi:hypothetical protein
MEYAFAALIESHVNIGDVEQTLLIRGLTSPAGHTAWTGLTCGAPWMLISFSTVRHRFVFVGTVEPCHRAAMIEDPFWTRRRLLRARRLG